MKFETYIGWFSWNEYNTWKDTIYFSIIHWLTEEQFGKGFRVVETVSMKLLTSGWTHVV